MGKSKTQNAKMIRVGIFFGGQSAEHEVSLQSAKNVLEALDKTKFLPTLIGIDKVGRWNIVDSDTLNAGLSSHSLQNKSSAKSFTLMPGASNEVVSIPSPEMNSSIDVALPILHGPLGEDGSIQGFFELAGMPYVGPNILGSAVGMDKDVMKRLLRDAGLPIAPYRVLHDYEISTFTPSSILEDFGSPVFVKPANMGSSVGVSRAASVEELIAAVKTAFEYDTKILIEKAVVGDEIECGILGNTSPLASVIGKIVPREADFYSYEAKYIDEKGATLEIPADIPEDISAKARDIALSTFKALGCEGMSRVDMFLTKNNEIIVNEINTIPGFTQISMYPKLWEASGIGYSELITNLIELALERQHRRSRLKTSF